MTNLSISTNSPANTFGPTSNKTVHLISNNHNENSLQGAKKSNHPNAALHKAASEFEAMFIKQMLNAMRKTTLKSNLTGGASSAQNIFEDLLYDEYSKTMANTGNFGIAKSLYDQLSNSM